MTLQFNPWVISLTGSKLKEKLGRIKTRDNVKDKVRSMGQNLITLRVDPSIMVA